MTFKIRKTTESKTTVFNAQLKLQNEQHEPLKIGVKSGAHK